MADDRPVILESRGNSAGPVAWVVGVVIVVAAILLVMFYWHPWSMTSTTNSTTVTQPANGSTQKSDTTTNTNTQPH
ncbi:MAG: hypothetical protein WAK11_14440 [Candidatus Cybelea sp.]